MAMCALEREINKGVRERLSRHGSRSSHSRRESSQVLVRPLPAPSPMKALKLRRSPRNVWFSAMRSGLMPKDKRGSQQGQRRRTFEDTAHLSKCSIFSTR